MASFSALIGHLPTLVASWVSEKKDAAKAASLAAAATAAAEAIATVAAAAAEAETQDGSITPMQITLAEAPITLKDILTNGEAKKLNHTIKAKIRKVAAETRTQLKNYNVSIHNHENLLGNIDALTIGNMPDGVKPFTF
jgi:hypothetical protein